MRLFRLWTEFRRFYSLRGHSWDSCKSVEKKKGYSICVIGTIPAINFTFLPRVSERATWFCGCNKLFIRSLTLSRDALRLARCLFTLVQCRENRPAFWMNWVKRLYGNSSRPIPRGVSFWVQVLLMEGERVVKDSVYFKFIPLICLTVKIPYPTSLVQRILLIKTCAYIA